MRVTGRREKEEDRGEECARDIGATSGWNKEEDMVEGAEKGRKEGRTVAPAATLRDVKYVS